MLVPILVEIAGEACNLDPSASHISLSTRVLSWTKLLNLSLEWDFLRPVILSYALPLDVP